MSENQIIVKCPHCNLYIIIKKKDYNCKIFRHGVYKNNLEKHIHPHLSKEECDKLKYEDKIYGCGKPFMLIDNSTDSPSAIKCDYI
tara:strand:- start:99 stop:356 length:258 start_codon:yes stop_codon:yes gene_type:complete